MERTFDKPYRYHCQRGGAILEFTITLALLVVLIATIAAPTLNLVRDGDIKSMSGLDSLVTSLPVVLYFGWDGKPSADPAIAAQANLWLFAASNLHNQLNATTTDPVKRAVCFFAYTIDRGAGCSLPSNATITFSDSTSGTTCGSYPIIPSPLGAKAASLAIKASGNSCYSVKIIGWNLYTGELTPVISVGGYLGALGSQSVTLAQTNGNNGPIPPGGTY